MTSTVQLRSAPVGSPPAQQRLRFGHGAVLRAIQENSLAVDIPGLGTVRLPPGDSLAWFGGLATLAALGIMEWPIAVVIGTGHLLAHQHHLRLLRSFGDALGSA
jgi:hypothetical protein